MSAPQTIQTVRLPLVTLTPLFLGGAEPRGQPELRASSVRGALRFWLRALLGGCYGTDGAALAKVSRLEAETFGEAGGRGSAGASKVLVRVLPPSRARSGSGQAASFIHPWDTPRHHPRSYLFFSMASSKVRGQEIPARSFIAPLFEFDLELALRPGAPEQEARRALYTAVRAAWLLLHLGGLGARARRLGGALAHRPVPRRTADDRVVTSVPRHLSLPFDLDPSPKEAAQELGEALTSLRKGFDCSPHANSARPAWEVLDPRWCRIWVFGERDWTSTERGWPAVAEAIGTWLRDTRRQLPTAQRLIFGAPLVIPQRGEAVPPPPGYEQADRRPSPLWLTVTRARNGNLLGIATLFQCQFLPRHSNSPEQLEELYDRIAEALSTLPNVAEVHYA